MSSNIFYYFIRALAVFFVLAPTSFLFAQTTLVSTGSSWKYLDNGTDQGTAWRSPSFSDTSWKTGNAQLGYGDGDEATIVSFGPNSSNRYVTTYFRRAFNVSDKSLFPTLNVRLLRDDGAVVYLNGTEIFRSNMPSGTITYTTFASSSVSDSAETTFFQASADGNLLVNGTNVLAVEVHNRTASSNDISFDLELTGTSTGGQAQITRGPYLQRGTQNSLSIRWRTNTPTNSRVRYSKNTSLSSVKDDSAITTEHVVRLTGLSSYTKYFYSVGTTTQTLASGPDYFFFTMPQNQTPNPTRIWVIGDSGTGNSNALAVRDAYYNFTGNRYTDVWLMLGDNAYENGTDAEYQTKMFDIYPKTLRQSILWPTIGNHDTAFSSNPPANLPYYQIFDLPMNGESHGLASGTEDYYSFSYGTIRFICLDSMTSSTSPGSPMLTWLENDLASNTKPWIIAYFHHPPYSKGGHDSDVESRSIAMRQNVLPILERYGVDLVLTGHSHSYERSFLLDGHYGLSSTLNSNMILDSGDGRTTGDGAYRKDQFVGNDGAVYIGAGNAGKISSAPLNHPAMFVSLAQLGSLVIDIDRNQIDVKMIRSNQTIADNFTLIKNNNAPVVNITNPSNNATFTNPNSITVSASVQDEGLRRVRFYAGTTHLGTDYNPPYSVVWNNPSAGSYQLKAIAEDLLMLSTTSPLVNITVK